MSPILGVATVILAARLVQAIGSCPEPPDVHNAIKEVFSDHVMYTCQTGPGSVSERTVIIRCEDGTLIGDPPTCQQSEWDICSEGCQCDQEKKNVTCYVEDITTVKKYVPKETKVLSIYSKPGTEQISYIPEGVFDNLIELRELYVEVDKKPDIMASFAGEGIAPLYNLETFKFTQIGIPRINMNSSANDINRCAGQTNCYRNCGEPNFLTERTERGSKITIHALNFNMRKLSGVTGEINVYAETVVLDSVVDIPEGKDHYIVTREFYQLGERARLRFTRSRAIACGVRMVRSRIGKRKLYLVRHGRVGVLAEHVKYRSHDKLPCRYTDSPPRESELFVPSLVQSRVATTCARILIDKERKKDRIVSRKMLNAQLMFLTSPLADELEGKELYMSAALQLLQEINARGRYVPYLSKDVYEQNLEYLHKNALLIIRDLGIFQNTKAEFASRKKAIQLMRQEAEDILEVAKLEQRNAADVLQVSKNALGKLKAEFQDAEKNLNISQKAFEDGVKAYEEAQRQSSILAVVQIVGSTLSSLFGAVTGDFSSMAQLISDVGALAETIIEIQAAINNLRSILAANEGIMKSVNRLEKNEATVNELLKDLDKAADLRVQVVTWDNIVLETDLVLGVGDIAGIRGCTDYRLALSTMAVWGKAVTEETIRQTQLVRNAVQKSLQLKITRKKVQRLRTARAEMVAEEKVTEDASLAVRRQAADVKFTLIDTLNQYCQSYFYFTFQECPAKPRLDDSLTRLLVRINRAKGAALKALGKLNGKPQDFRENITIEDTAADGCNKNDQCPVARFKQNGRLIAHIDPEDHQRFSQCERRRVEEILVFLIGVEVNATNCPVVMTIRTSGEFRDSFRGVTYYFTSAPLFLGYKYYPLKHNAVTTPGRVHGKYDTYYTETSLFTTWLVTLSQSEANCHVDLDKLKAIKLSFSGSCIWKDSPSG